jgi:hypothetical protein
MPLDPEPVEENLLSFEQLQVIELISKPGPKSEIELQQLMEYFYKFDFLKGQQNAGVTNSKTSMAKD